jgi:hypothetical protein
MQLEDVDGNPIPGTSEEIPRSIFPGNCQPERIARDYAEARRKEHPEAYKFYLSWGY